MAVFVKIDAPKEPAPFGMGSLLKFSATIFWILIKCSSDSRFVSLETLQSKLMPVWKLIKETIISAKSSIPVVEKKESVKKETKSSKTLQEKDREKLDEKFSKKKKETINWYEWCRKSKKIKSCYRSWF